MGSPYVEVEVLRGGLVYRSGQRLRVTAGQAHLWERMGLARRADLPAAETPRPAATRPRGRRRKRRGAEGTNGME